MGKLGSGYTSHMLPREHESGSKGGTLHSDSASPKDSTARSGACLLSTGGYDLPDPHDDVGPACGEVPPVRAEDHDPHRSLVTIQFLQVTKPGSSIPEPSIQPSIQGRALRHAPFVIPAPQTLNLSPTRAALAPDTSVASLLNLTQSTRFSVYCFLFRLLQGL